VTFLRAIRHLLTDDFWRAVALEHADAPPAMRELARGDSSVVCDRAEADASLAWARAHRAWTESPAPVSIAIN
jgi:hypothetical protein